MARSAKIVTKIKKKRWVQLFAPKSMNNTFLGESFTDDPQNLLNRSMKINLMTITNDMKKQNMTIRFRVDNVSGEKASTEFLGYEIVPSAIRRLIRRGKDRVDYTLFFKTKDNKNLKINIIIITRANTYKSVRTTARQKINLLLGRRVTTSNLDDFVKDVIDHKVQENLVRSLKSVYPLKLCEIRSISIVRDRRESLEKKKEVKLAVKPEEENESNEIKENKSEKKDVKEEAKVKEEIKEVKKEDKKESKEEVKEEKEAKEKAKK
ncbi:MAG: hypothetical protein V1740_04005 [Candidatus Woesearchaeota archaeon]